MLLPLHDLTTYRTVTAERAFLSTLGGGCAAPVAAYAIQRNGLLEINGLVASPDGQTVIRVFASGADPVATGELLAHQALDQGAGDLLK